MTAISDALELYFDTEPVVASRPRVSKWGTYYGDKYKAWLKDAPKFLPQLAKPLEGALVVSIKVVCTKAKSSKLQFPKGDVDNYAKGILDVITHAGIWGDDSQVVRMSISKRFVREGESAGVTVVITKGDDYA